MIDDGADLRSMRLALERARDYLGSTAPNPPVGSVAIDADGNVLASAAHERAGEPHAEAKVIGDLRTRGILDRVARLYVTLEPCNHTGRTPPCAAAILASGIREVRYGAPDPNVVAAGGAEYLRARGIDARLLDSTRGDCLDLIAGFSKWVKSRVPYVVVKTAHRGDAAVGFTAESMHPPASSGKTTFTSADSLARAHLLRRSCDAVLTTAATIRADDPRFTVRHVPDFPGKRRFLSIFARAPSEVADTYVERATRDGFDVRVVTAHSFAEELAFLGNAGAHRALVEAGPRFSETVLRSTDWDEHLEIVSAVPGTGADSITSRRR